MCEIFCKEFVSDNWSSVYNITNSQNFNKTSVYYDDNNIFENPAKIGIITGLLIAWLADIKILPSKVDSCSRYIKLSTIAITTLNFILCFIFSPLFFLIFIFFSTYRKIINFILKIHLDDEYVGLFKGTDCVWALEDPSALSVINIFTELELDSSTITKNILEDFQRLIKEKLLLKNFEKLFWHREKKYGYHYWKKNKNLDEEIILKNQVRWMNDNHDNNCNGTCNDIYRGNLRKRITQLCNQPLPENHKTCWEIFVGNNCKEVIKKNSQNQKEKSFNSTNEKKIVSILFRVHHSVGDGVALLRLLLEALSDARSSEFKVIPMTFNNHIVENDKNKINNIRQKSKWNFNSINSEIIYYSNDLLSASMPFSSTLPMMLIIIKFLLQNIVIKMENFTIVKNDAVNLFDTTKKFILQIIKTLHMILLIPSSLINQMIRSRDKSAIHGPKLTGEKIISCWIENDFNTSSDKNLFSKIRDIKKLKGTRFADVILASLSSNINKYFQETGEIIPKKLTVVIPARMTNPCQNLILENSFSVGLMNLCVSQVNGKLSNDSKEKFDYKQLLERLKDVSKSSEKLRKDPDYLINYWVMNWLSAILPEIILKPFLQSYSTMVFSNLPGPEKITIMGHKLNKIVFWIPNRGTTGIGCSVLIYGGNIQISIIADKAVISKEHILDKILKGTVEDIAKLHKHCFY